MWAEERHVRRNFAALGIERVIDAAARSGHRLSMLDKLSGGAWGAWLVAAPDGQIMVLKCLWESDWRLRLTSAEAVVDALIARGMPVPRYIASGFEPQLGTWLLQEHRVGQPAVQITRSLLPQVLRCVEGQNGVGAVLPDVFDWRNHVAQWRTRSVPAILERLRRCSYDGAVLATEVGRLLKTGPLSQRTSPDAVHGDLLATQLLVSRGRLTSVIDWDAATR
jgi:Phosphotransferase enzyme family